MNTIAALLVAAAPALACYEAPGTRSMTCIDQAAVRVNGDVRASPLFTGGPNGVRKTSQTFVVDCKLGVSTLQDRNGVNFAGDLTSTTPLSRALSQWTCEAKQPKKDPKLRQF